MPFDPPDLTEAECWQLLSAGGLARVAITFGALPRIVAARYRVEGARILVRVACRARLSPAFDGTVVTVAADSLSDTSDYGWLVEASGFAHLDAGGEGLFRDRPDTPGIVASIEPMTVTGSTYHLGDP